MPSISGAISAGQANAAASPGGVNVPAPAEPQGPAPSTTPLLDLPGGGGLPQRGMFPANLVLSGDRNDSSRVFRGPGARSAVFPFPVAQTPQATTIVTAASASVEAAVAALSISTNNALNPVQNKLNFQSSNSNLIISSDSNGNEIFTVANSGGDGLIHGELPWETDPAAVVLQDDFASGSVTSVASAIGSLGWTAIALNSSITPYMWPGGPFPITGEVSLPNDSTANAGNFLYLNNPILTSLGSVINSWPLLDFPSWKMTWIFRFQKFSEASLFGSPFAMTQKSFYAGSYCAVSQSMARPNVFMGLRYDTDPTAPAISDTTFNFEVVTNPLGSSRINTQGQVFNTGVTPVQDQQYRFEMLCTAAGVVTMSLSTGTTTVSNTFTIPAIVVTGSGSISSNANSSRLDLPSGQPQPWTNGTQLNITVPAIGIVSLTAGDNGGELFWTGNASTFSGTLTCSAFPCFSPVVFFGNDTTATPVQNAVCRVDFFGFAWNPGVGGGTGTPNPVKPRYF